MNGRDIRIGDLERDQAITQLHEQFALGRLGRDELDARLEAAFKAKTVGDLRTIVLDLPTSTEAVAWRHGRQPASLQPAGKPQGQGQTPGSPRMIGLLPFVPFLMFMIVIGVSYPALLLMPMMMFFWVIVAATAMRSRW